MANDVEVFVGTSFYQLLLTSELDLFEEFLVRNAEDFDDFFEKLVAAFFVFEGEGPCVEILHYLGEDFVGNVLDVDFRCGIRAFNHSCFEHRAVLFGELTHDDFVGVEGLTFNHESYISKLWVIDLLSQTQHQLLSRIARKVPLWTRVSIKLKHIFQVVLSIASTNNVELRADKSHGVASSHFGELLGTTKVVSMRPVRTHRVEGVQIVEALGVGAGTSKQEESSSDVAK